MLDNIYYRICNCVAHELNCNVDMISGNAGWNATNGWDSITHIAIITSVESEFQIHIPDEKIVELVSVELIFKYINSIKMEVK